MRETEKKPVNSIHQPTTKCKTLVEIDLPKPDDDHLQTQTLDGPRSNNSTANGFRVSTSGGGGVKSEGTGDKETDIDTEVDVGITLAQLSKERMSGGKIITTQQHLPSEEGTDLTSPNGNYSTAIASVGGGSTVARRRTAGSSDLTVVAEKPDESKFGDGSGSPVIADGKKESDFPVGEFVWGKLKTYPWWPGRVYDPSDASDYALNHKPQDERQLLVAFFGDATFGWCNPSQLKPFVENFVEMSGQNTSRGFVQAVEDAASEFARLLKLELTGSTEEKTIDDDIVNAGIKDGVKPPREGVRLYAVERFQPKEVISDLRRLGMSVNAVDLLKRVTLMSQVSVICKGKDELVEVEQYGNTVQDDDGGEKNVTFAGPPVEDVVAGEELEGSNQDEIGTMTSEHRALSSKRKSKSISEILDRATTVVNEVISDEEEEEEDDDDANVKGKDQSRRTGSKSRKYKRRRVETLCKEAQEPKDEGDGKLVGLSSKGNNQRKGLKDDELQVSAAVSTSSRLSQRLKGVSKEGGHDLAIESLDQKHKGKKKREDSPPPPSPVGSLEVVEIVSGPRERKKSKYLSPPFTNVAYEPRISTLLKAFEHAEGSSNATQTGDGVASSSTLLAGSAPDAKLSGQGEKVDETAKEAGVSGQNEAHPSSTQQMTPNIDKKHPQMSIVSPNSVLSQVQSAALTARPSDGSAGERSSSRRTKSLYRMTKEKSEETKAPAQDNNIKEKNAVQSKVKKQANATDIESQVKDPDAKKQASAARNKAMGKEQKTIKKQQASDASGDESTGKKQKNTKQQQPNDSGKENQGHAPSNKKQENAANKETRGKDPSSEPDGHIVDDKSSSSLSSAVATAAALSLKFPPDFPLPSETDLTAMFRSFGFSSLDASKTKVFQHSSSAKVVFLISSDAKAAMQRCKEGNPFGSTAVTYRVRNLRAAPSSAVAADTPNGNKNAKVLSTGGGSSSVKTKSTTSKKKRSAPVGLLEAEGLKFVKRKLEEMTTMVSSADGKVTVEMKSTLEAEIKVLLDKVRVLPAS